MRTVRWIRNWLSCLAQRIVVNSTKPGHCWCAPGVVLRPVVFSVFNDLVDGAECTLPKPADDTELGGVVDTTKGCAAIQRNLNGLEESHQVQQRGEQSLAPGEE